MTRGEPRKEKPPTERASLRVSTAISPAMVLAILAAATFTAVRAESQWRVWFLAADLGLSLILAGALIPAGSLAWRKRASPRCDRFLPTPAAAMLAAYVAYPLALHSFCRFLFGIGDPFEIVMLAMIQNAALGGAAFGQWKRCRQVSRLLSAFLVLFATALATGPAAFIAACVFGFVGLWSLMGDYWDGLRGKFANDSKREFPEVLRRAPRAGLRLAMLSAVAGAALIALALGGAAAPATNALRGIFPTSGGDGMSDPYAREGVNDGDMLVAAQDEAMSFGPVESELFLDSEMPSLYDMYNDAYGEPMIRKKAEKAIAISANETRESEQKIAETKSSGREFSAVRKGAERRTDSLADRQAPAMLYVVGATPLHLTLETFDTFDGVRWTSSAVPSEPAFSFAVERRLERPWIRVAPTQPAYLNLRQTHAIKFINLKSNRIPAPANLTAVHIDRLDRVDFFARTNDGQIEMCGRESVPQLTVVHLESGLPRIETLRENGWPLPAGLPAGAAAGTSAGAPAGGDRRPPVQSTDAEKLARAWTAGSEPGWAQIEAVVAGLRTEFFNDPDARTPSDCEDVVAHFLTCRRGPDYLFATTAVVMLRSLGYEARVASGLYADPNDYDRAAGQTVVGADDVHFWAEARVEGETWLALEPTPGYEPPRYDASWRELFRGYLSSAWGWVKENPLAALATIAFAIALVAGRAALLDVLAYAWWRIGSVGGSRRRIGRTLALLSFRSRLAGCRRSATCTLTDWSRELARHASPEERDCLMRFVGQAERVLYGGFSEDAAQRNKVARACADAALYWTSRRMRRPRKNSHFTLTRWSRPATA